MTFDNLALDDRRRLSRAAWCRPNTSRDGMCSGCGYAFRGITAFDLHQTGKIDGAICDHPSTKAKTNGQPGLTIVDHRTVEDIEVPVWGRPDKMPTRAVRRGSLTDAPESVHRSRVLADSPPPVPEQGSQVADVTGEVGR